MAMRCFYIPTPYRPYGTLSVIYDTSYCSYQFIDVTSDVDA